VAIGNAIFVRNPNSLTKNEQSMRSFAIQTGRDGHRLNRISKIQEDDLLLCFFRVGQLEIKLPLRKPAR